MTIVSNKKDVMQLPHQILTGTTWHARHTPNKHSFSYPYRYWGLSLNKLAEGNFPVSAGLFSQKSAQSEEKKGRLFTTHGRGLHSFNFADYFDVTRLDDSNPDNAEYKSEYQAKCKAERKQEQYPTTTEQTKLIPNDITAQNKQHAKKWLANVQQAFQRLTDSQPTGDILALVVSRNLGMYFSPVNFYLGFDDKGNASHLLAEVSNTPWDKSHFYGFKLDGNEIQSDTGKPNRWEFSHNKDFHVSPFNPLDQVYTWKITLKDVLPSPHLAQRDKDLTSEEEPALGLKNIKLSIHVSDSRGKVFGAGINMKSQAMTSNNVRQTIRKNPMMNYSSMARIYWHAFLLYVIKKVPYIGYNQKLKASKQHNKNNN